MGDLRVGGGGGGGVVANEPMIGLESWARAEESTRKIISKVQPTSVSEDRRRNVIEYVQRLIKTCLGCEVFPYGSVPLKTYLPDGDIDLTAFGGIKIEDSLANDIVSVLEAEDQNPEADFIVKDVQLIRAEVKLVKCIVQNIVVDISFNQIGGLCTLCFLEQVDRLIGKDHLFKRSIILIKAWCYYESRILGAHHGLISTYALETLVLYIFHLFHSRLNGPLAVLYKFLDYFSSFDWENYCISLTGPLLISALPEFVVKTPVNCSSNLLLSDEFLRFCTNTFSAPNRAAETNLRTFQPKHLNIVDPLKENNNLGRSVSKGNFFRIRSAFTYGARKLARILMQPESDIADELQNFFSNTLDRHGSGQRPDVIDSFSVSIHSDNIPALSHSESEFRQGEKLFSELNLSTSSTGRAEDYKFKPNISSHDGANNIRISSAGFHAENGGQECSTKVSYSMLSSEANEPTKSSLLGHRCCGDAMDLATARIQGLKISSDLPQVKTLSGGGSISGQGIPYHAPHLYFSKSKVCNGETRNGNSGSKPLDHCEKKISSELQGSDERRDVMGHSSNKSSLVGEDEAPLHVVCSQDTRHVNRDSPSASDIGNPESLKSSSDLSGDYESHFKCLQYGRRCFEYSSSMQALPVPPPPPPQYPNIRWDMIARASQIKQNGFSHGTPNGVIPGPAFYPVNTMLMPGVTFGFEELPKPRGTGTYFPNTNRPPQGYRPSAVKGRHQAPSRSPRNNGWTASLSEGNMLDGSNRDPLQSEGLVDQSYLKLGPPEAHNQPFSPHRKGPNNVNGFFNQSEGAVEFGSVGDIPFRAPLIDSRRHQRPASLSPQDSSPVSTPGTQRPKPFFSRDQDRVSAKSSYHLRDEDDFPPLSV